MNPNVIVNDVFSSTGSTSRKATINANAASFKALYSDTYSDKIGSMIRETVSNGIDSHNNAKTDKPVVVKLPSEFNLTYRVEDFGTGIDPERIWDLGLSYFASTKQESDEDIGGFGIGFKSPFAYLGMFDVWNYWNGKEYHYKFMLDEYGVPSGDLVMVKDTDRENGVVVSVPVKMEDIEEFKTKAEVQLRFFKEGSIVYQNHHKPHPKFINVDGEFGFTRGLNGQQMVLNLGGVGYHISSSLLPKDSVILPYMGRMGYGLVINARIADASPALSREYLSMDDKTTSYLKGALEKVDQHIRDMVQVVVNGVTTIEELQEMSDEEFNNFDFCLNYSPNPAIIDGMEMRNITGLYFDVKGLLWSRKRIDMSGRTITQLSTDINVARHKVVIYHDDIEKRAGVVQLREAIYDSRGSQKGLVEFILSHQASIDDFCAALAKRKIRHQVIKFSEERERLQCYPKKKERRKPRMMVRLMTRSGGEKIWDMNCEEPVIDQPDFILQVKENDMGHADMSLLDAVHAFNGKVGVYANPHNVRKLKRVFRGVKVINDVKDVVTEFEGLSDWMMEAYHSKQKTKTRDSILSHKREIMNLVKVNDSLMVKKSVSALHEAISFADNYKHNNVTFNVDSAIYAAGIDTNKPKDQFLDFVRVKQETINIITSTDLITHSTARSWIEDGAFGERETEQLSKLRGILKRAYKEKKNGK